MDSIQILADVHPSLVSSTPGQTKNISNVTIEGLTQTIHSLEEEKRVRLQKLQELRAKLLELWNLMDTPIEEQQLLQHITSHIAATQDEITIPGTLSSDTIAQAQMEVDRLDTLKASRMKELVDENRFASKGAHLNLKRAERARAAINKLPGQQRTCHLSRHAKEDVGILPWSLNLGAVYGCAGRSYGGNVNLEDIGLGG
ncbi:unnamed protein product [Sphagnum jensenii]|uniref:Uncharacterized protein n=1 Tax=Sphagnum jensenii TaxID=128206 RepID=A0ABP0V838_9BRYO